MNGMSFADVFSLGVIAGAIAVYIQFAILAWRDCREERDDATFDS